MRKTIVFLFLSSLAAPAAHSQNALEQLEGLSRSRLETAVPEAAAAEKKWDPSAPFSYHQNRGAVVSRDGAATLGNVRWGEAPWDHRSYDWRTAELRPETLSKVYYGYKTSGVGHSFFVFVFGEGGFSSGGSDGVALTAGAEGWTREPEGYNVLYGFMDRYPLIWNLTTFESYADFTVTLKHSRLFLAEIKIPRGKALELLSATLDRIERTNASAEFYHSVSNNCTTNPVALLNSVLPEDKRVDERDLGLVTPTSSLPALAVRKYRRLGVLAEKAVAVDESNFRGFDIRGL